MLKLKLLFLFLLYVNYGKYYVVKSQNKNQTCDLVKTQNNCEYQDVKPGDKITFTCKHASAVIYNNQYVGEYSERCYAYVNKQSNGQIVPLNRNIFRINDFSSTKSNGITTTLITIPPFVFKDVDFRCDCYMESNENVNQFGDGNKFVKRTLIVHVKKQMNGPIPDVKGCNLRRWETDNNLPNLVHVKNPDFANVCNVYGVKGSDYVTAICPNDETIDPPDCFTNVYQYKEDADFLSTTLKENTYEKVKISTLLSNKELKSVEGGTTLKYGQIPENVTEKVLFFCTCVAQNNKIRARMNFFVNILEDDALDTWLKLRSNPYNAPVTNPLNPVEPPKSPATNPEEPGMEPKQDTVGNQREEASQGTSYGAERASSGSDGRSGSKGSNETVEPTKNTKDATEKESYVRTGSNFSCNITFSLLSLFFIIFAYIF